LDKEKTIKKNDESKLHPIAKDTEKDISTSGNKIKKFVKSIEANTQQDINAVQGHQNRLSHWYNRRYGLLDKDPQYPWPGSSNINMPLIDSEVSKSKAPLMQLVETNPITDAAENTMEWLLTTRMRGFKDTVEMIADGIGMYGYAIGKVTYEYKTCAVKETIYRKEITEDELKGIALLFASLEQGQALDGQPFTQEDFDINMSDFIAERWEFDIDDIMDQKAIEKIMNWIGDEKKESVQITRTFVEHDAPNFTLVDNSKIYPEEGIKDLQDAERITEIFEETPNDMRKKAQTGWYDPEAVKKILNSVEQEDVADGNGVKGKREEENVSISQLNTTRKDREGLSATARRGVICMKEVSCLYDIDNDGVDERCLLIYHPDSETIVRFMEHPYEHGMWPYIKFDNEKTDGRYHSPRGYGEILNEIDNVITQNHRNKLNAMTIANNPTFKYRLSSNFNPNQVRWIPGQFIPVMNMADFEQVNVQTKDFSFDNEEVNLKFWGEQLVGSFDTAFRQQRSEARTAQEVSAIQGIQQAATSLRVSRFQRSMKQVYEQIWALWMQYGDERFTAILSDGELRHYTKSDISGSFDMVPVGTITNTNPEAQLFKARETLASLSQMMETGLLQVAAQRYNMDIGIAVKDVLNKTDFISSQRIMQPKSQEQLQAEAQAQQQAQAAQAQQQQAQQAIDENRPMPIGELQNQLKELEKQSPNGGAQRVQL
jgi:hypothetical protein